jgi:hypothetical protein
MHLDYVLSCRVIAVERRRVLARMLHESPDRVELGAASTVVDAAVMRVDVERTRFRAHAGALHARLATSRLFERGELAALRERLASAVAAIDAAASRVVSQSRGRDGAHLATVGGEVAEPSFHRIARGTVVPGMPEPADPGDEGW